MRFRIGADNFSRPLAALAVGAHRSPTRGVNSPKAGDPDARNGVSNRAYVICERPRQPWPNWGRFDAHAWLGQALARHGDNAGARAEYAAALRIAPSSEWVRTMLLPQVGKD